jgi:hypothetical protein
VPGGSNATSAAATGWGRRVASYRLAAAEAGTAGPGVAVVVKAIIAAGRSGRTVVSVPVTSLGRIVTVAVTVQLTGIGIGSRAVDPVVGIRDPRGKAVAIAGAVESTQMGIYVVIIRASFYDNDAAAIVGIIEVRIITGVPEEIAVPSKVGICETQAEPIGKSVAVHGVSVSESHTIIRADRRGIIIGVVGIIIVEIRPAGLILCFQTYVVVAGRCAVVLAPIGGTSAVVSCLLVIGRCRKTPGRTGRIIYIIRCLCGLPGGRAAAEQDKADGQEGKYLSHGESI